jgi:hypothetical protein
MGRVRPRGSREGSASCEGGAKPRLETAGTAAQQQILAHLEEAPKRYEAWSEHRNPGHIAAMRQFMQQMRGQAASAAKA